MVELEPQQDVYYSRKEDPKVVADKMEKIARFDFGPTRLKHFLRINGCHALLRGHESGMAADGIDVRRVDGGARAMITVHTGRYDKQKLGKGALVYIADDFTIQARRWSDTKVDDFEELLPGVVDDQARTIPVQARQRSSAPDSPEAFNHSED